MPPPPRLDDPVAPLLAYLRERYPLSDEHAARVRSMVQPRELARGECLQRAGEVTRYTAFVVRGLLRSYVLEEDGREHVVRFAAENWWVGDPESAAAQVPSRFSFEAIEPSLVLCLTYPNHLRMMEEIPGHAASYARGIQRWAAARERWILGNLSDTADERYREFLETYPGIAARVPLRMIASYLGLAPETLSRVRRRLTARPRATREAKTPAVTASAPARRPKPAASRARPRPRRGSRAD